ncbi:hypothetical protein [Hymenobacter cellulosivorans]|uniref:YcxB family protein n=1 Tax=Hymenobacter cellulosivorans TaxID=2932249 RepID=A0ABY4FBW8_9BACT|nr:hypothetical protein [Hymenobacter cellulosivorans]UOQ54030.1 hypothetical protein MUN80_04535 [Hymenobacter cellulosivorans]
MQQPNQRGGYRQAQGPAPMAIRTKKYQLDTDTYTRMAMAQVWKKEWWYALIPLAIGLLPAVIWPSWWWLLLAVLLTLLFVLLRSAQITGVAQMEQSKALFERMNYEIDNRQIVLRQSETKGMGLTWDMIGQARRDNDAYLLWLQPPAAADELKGFKGWMARTFNVPIFLHFPLRIFNSPNDIKLFDSMLRRKNLLPAQSPAAPAPTSPTSA